MGKFVMNPGFFFWGGKGDSLLIYTSRENRGTFRYILSQVSSYICRDISSTFQVIQFVTFSSPSWRSLNHWKGSLNHLKRVTLNHQVTFFWCMVFWLQCPSNHDPLRQRRVKKLLGLAILLVTLFAMVICDPFKGYISDLQLGGKKVTNWITWGFWLLRIRLETNKCHYFYDLPPTDCNATFIWSPVWAASHPAVKWWWGKNHTKLEGFGKPSKYTPRGDGKTTILITIILYSERKQLEIVDLLLPCQCTCWSSHE